MRLKTLGLVAVALTASVGAVRADTVYTNFGPGFSYDTSSGWSINGAATIFGYQAISESFTPGANYSLTSVDLALFGTSSYIVQLNADASGAPGAILEAWLTTPSTSPVNLVSATNALLASGTQYWVSVLPATPTDSGAWNFNTQSITGFSF